MRSRFLIIIVIALIFSVAFAPSLVAADGGTASLANDDTTNAQPPVALQLGASANKITVHFFWAIGCSHCANTIPFIDALAVEYPQVDFIKYEVSHNSTNWALYQSYNQRYHVSDQKVPAAFIGDSALIGEDAIKADLESIIVRLLNAIDPPTAPQNLRATPGNMSVNLTWQEPADDGGAAITNYEVWRGNSTGAETFLADAGTKLAYNNTDLVNNQTYYYIIKAENSKGLSPSSNEVSAIPSPTASVPTAPVDLVVTPGNGSAVLTWTAPSNDGGSPVLNYMIYGGTTPGGETSLTTVVNATTYRSIDLINGQTYYYQVSAVNLVGESARSIEESVTPVEGEVPSAPANLKATPDNSEVKLQWAAPSYSGPGTITYHLFRDGIEIWNGTGTEYIDQGVVNGVEYSYTIAASNILGLGPSSDSVLAKPTPEGSSTDLTVLTVIVAAAVDSINPCAISVMIFLLLFLTSMGNKRRVAMVGITYIVTVYVVYFMAGLGLLTFLQSITVTRYIYYVAAVISIVIGVINIKDYFFPGEKPTVAIPESRKPLIKKYIEKASIPAAIALGGIVALFELPCTGAIYFAILNLLGDKMTIAEGIPYLALYNFIFVLPLIIILVVILMGVSAETANSWRLENRSILRLIVGVVMVILGAMMLTGVF